MAKRKPSFFERLTGSISADDYEDELEDDKEISKAKNGGDQIEEIGQLSVDMYNTQNEIVIKAMVAGVKPDDLDVTIARDMVTIEGKREGERTIEDENYYHRELYWGSFSRKVILPEEIDVDSADASQKEGLLIIRLPKVNKDRRTKLKVRSN